jgi:hypothetical protein
LRHAMQLYFSCRMSTLAQIAVPRGLDKIFAQPACIRLDRVVRTFLSDMPDTEWKANPIKSNAPSPHRPPKLNVSATPYLRCNGSTSGVIVGISDECSCARWLMWVS